MGLTRKQFDSRKGATWHCVVGRNFGSFVTHGNCHRANDAGHKAYADPFPFQKRSILSTSISVTAPSYSSRHNRLQRASDPYTTVRTENRPSELTAYHGVCYSKAPIPLCHYSPTTARGCLETRALYSYLRVLFLLLSLLFGVIIGKINLSGIIVENTPDPAVCLPRKHMHSQFLTLPIIPIKYSTLQVNTNKAKFHKKIPRNRNGTCCQCHAILIIKPAKRCLSHSATRQHFRSQLNKCCLHPFTTPVTNQSSAHFWTPKTL